MREELHFLFLSTAYFADRRITKRSTILAQQNLALRIRGSLHAPLWTPGLAAYARSKLKTASNATELDHVLRPELRLHNRFGTFDVPITTRKLTTVDKMKILRLIPRTERTHCDGV